jgi:glycosyltransferase involved in cell wall biosynthesis
MVIIVYANDCESVYDLFFLKYLVKSNYVYLLTFNQKPNMVPQGVNVVKIPEPFHPTSSPLIGLNTYLGSFHRSVLLKTHLRQITPDVLIGCGGLSYGFYCALSNYLPYILFIWGSDVLVAPRWLYFRFMAKYSLKKARGVVVDSDVQEKACIKLGCNPEKIVKFPWVDLQPLLEHIENNVSEQKRNTDNLREEFGWHKDDPIIISTRHHEPIYNLECLMQAIPHVVKEFSTVRFLILGKGSLTEKLRNMAMMMGVSVNVKFVGCVPLSEMARYLRMADIYVSTSLSDGTSASLLEAMACKIPPIVTDIPGNREWIKNGENGLLFPTKDHKALAENIIKLLKDDNSKKSLGKKAYDTVVKKADWQKNSKLLDNLISSLVHTK